jgi:hypothetical protein
MIPFTWLMAGALMGHAQLLARARQDSQRSAAFQQMHGARPRKTVI